MDLLQIALIFLILLLSIFLAITGFQVFLILRDLKKALDKFNNVLKSGEQIVSDIEKPIEATTALAAGIVEGAKSFVGITKKETKPKSKRFYKKVL